MSETERRACCSYEADLPPLFESEIPKLKGILFAEFDNEIGRVLKFQVPGEVVNRKQFEHLSSTLIPAEEWRDRLIRVSIFDLRLLGFPVGLRSERYHREMYIFNMCLLLDKADPRDDAVYEPLVQKLAEYLVHLEKEVSFLTARGNELPAIMRRLFEDLNSTGECVLSVTAECTLYLKACPQALDAPDSEPLNQFMVPVFVRQPPPTSPAELSKLDVLSQKVCPHINGILCIRDIAARVQIDVGLVARCMRNLHATGGITFLPLFLYAHQYVARPAVRTLLADRSVQKKCVEFIRRSFDAPPPRPSDVFRLYASLTPGVSFSQWCKERRPRAYNIDERRFVQFGVHFGFLQPARPFAYTEERPSLLKAGREDEPEEPERRPGACEVADDERPVDELAVGLSVSPFALIKQLDRTCSASVIYR
ncbi:Nitrogen permease regulator 2-like protein [Aphelenchoides fujianensis]|nr:Nitrogen permease regulator 2-like protein [Aphelenchoides fujianensis]